ncbi:hypothetical protein BgiBS90_009872 [Biomphalaria glabrata]|nr:hypothetical protein BgiBS90_009872 [Biomphalaria glabrata]
MSTGEIANTGPNNGRGRNNEFDFGSGIRENSILGNCIQAIDMNCICGVLRGQWDSGGFMGMKLKKTVCLKPWLAVGLQLCHDTSMEKFR